MYKLDWKLIGKNIRFYRQRRQLLQINVAKALGITQTHLSNLEAGRGRITLEHLVAMANIYDCTLDELVITPDYTAEKEKLILDGNKEITSKDMQMAIQFLKAIRNLNS